MKLVAWILSISAIVAAGVFAFVLMRYDLALLSAVSLLAAAQIVAMIASRHPHEVDDARLASLAQRISKNSADIETLSRKHKDQAQKIAEHEHIISPGNVTRPPVNWQAPQSPASSGMQTPVPAGIQPRRVEHRPGGPAREHHRPAPAASSAGSLPQLCLEPVVRLAEGRTAYYKASFQSASVALAQGRSHARPDNSAGDFQMLEQVLPLLLKLRARRGTTGIFCPLSAETLEDMDALKAYVGILQSNQEAAAGIVIDLDHEALAGLGEAGMRGLAWLASLGATFCLTSDQLHAGDITALAELGFAFMDVPAGALLQSPHAYQASASASFVQSASDNNIALVASGIMNSADAAPLASLSSLGRGPGFAPPRVVKASPPDLSVHAKVA